MHGSQNARQPERTAARMHGSQNARQPNTPIAPDLSNGDGVAFA
jgi:hypothetical protein